MPSSAPTVYSSDPAAMSGRCAIGTHFANSSLELFVQNAFDKRGELNRNTFCQILICGPVALRVYSVKPQFFGIKFGQKF